MENCGFINNDPVRETTFGNANTFIHMTRKWEAWEDVRLMLRMEPEYTALRDTVQDILLRTGHMNSQQLAETVPNLPQADRETLADLLAHMAQVQDEVTDHIHNRLVFLESLGFSALPEDDDDVTCLSTEYSLSTNEEGKPDEVPSESWKYIKDDEKPLVRARWDK